MEEIVFFQGVLQKVPIYTKCRIWRILQSWGQSPQTPFALGYAPPQPQL
jgi:hypothetical protein